MKEFIEKLIDRLEEIKTYYAEDFSQGYSCEADCVEKYEVKKIVNQLAEEYRNDKVCQTAIMYAENLYRYGIQVDSIWETATQQSMALNQAYLRGRQDERDKFSKWREEHDNVMINAQYCWQTCSAIEHCKECNRLCNGSIDYYENYDVLAEEYINTSSDTSSDTSTTNADRIRSMTDEELAEFLGGIDHTIDDCEFIVKIGDEWLHDSTADILDWLQSEVEGVAENE